MIAVDWGTSSLRLYRLDAGGMVLERGGGAQKGSFEGGEIDGDIGGGCISGGGQPYTHLKEEVLVKRASAIYTEDERKTIRKSHENPSIISLYKDYLGSPGSTMAHKLLHTEYFPKSNEVTINLHN